MIYIAYLAVTLFVSGADALCTPAVSCSTELAALGMSLVSGTEVCTKYGDLRTCSTTNSCGAEEAKQSADAACMGKCDKCSGGGGNNVNNPGTGTSCSATTNCYAQVGDVEAAVAFSIVGQGSDLCTKYGELKSCYTSHGCTADEAKQRADGTCPTKCGSCNGADAVKSLLSIMLAAIIFAYISI